MIDQFAYYDNIVAYCDLGYDLIFAPGNQYTVAVLQAAEEYPDVAFAPPQRRAPAHRQRRSTAT